MDGTPMSAYDYVPAEELWHLVHFLQSRQKKLESGSLKMSQKIISHSTAKIMSDSTEDPVWKDVESVSVKLRALQSASGRPSFVNVQSLHNRRQIAFRLKWKDETPEVAKPGAAFYLDAIALQFSSSSEFGSIYYGMGERKKPVNIWHWKADSFQVVEGNAKSNNKLVLNPFNEKSVEEINASGFGTLTVQSLEDQQVTGKGVWMEGEWTVVFLRNLKTASPFDIQFTASEKSIIAFALWDGQKKEKNANKRVSFWQQLVIP
jgi:DMSO reductase family type II enzyme heme b subunit